MRSNVAKLNFLYSDKRLVCACQIDAFKRIEHANWASKSGLLLLLWTNLDVPPYRVVDHDIDVADVSNLSSSYP